MAVGEVLERFGVDIDALCAVDPGVLSDEETLVQLSAQLDRLEAVVTRATARFEADGGFAGCGARTGAHWLATKCHLPLGTARRRLRLGQALRHMPVTEEAWLAGEIGAAHVGALDSARSPETAESFARDEKALVDNARELVYGAFKRTLDYWCQLADPDGTERSAEELHDSRRVHMSKSFDGRWYLDSLFDPIAGSIISSELKRLEDEMFTKDWAEAKARVGEGVKASDLSRTPAQRRADAMAEMARRSGGFPHGGRLPEPLFSVFVGYETFAGRICELANGSVVSPGSLVPYLDDAWIERIVFDGPSRVIDVGTKRRLFTGATRRAVQVRDRECFHPYCDTPATECEVDHVQPWSQRGPTTEANGRAACDFHNRQRHRGGEADPGPEPD